MITLCPLLYPGSKLMRRQTDPLCLQVADDVERLLGQAVRAVARAMLDLARAPTTRGRTLASRTAQPHGHNRHSRSQSPHTNRVVIGSQWTT